MTNNTFIVTFTVDSVFLDPYNSDAIKLDGINGKSWRFCVLQRSIILNVTDGKNSKKIVEVRMTRNDIDRLVEIFKEQDLKNDTAESYLKDFCLEKEIFKGKGENDGRIQ